jgi:hypothetical protein
MLLSQLHIGQWQEAYKLPGFYVTKHKCAHEQAVCEKEIGLDKKTQYHLPQPRVFHNRQWHVAFSNHKNKIFN